MANKIKWAFVVGGIAILLILSTLILLKDEPQFEPVAEIDFGGVPSNITGPKGRVVETFKMPGDATGLIVYTEADRDILDPEFHPFLNPNFGIAMNLDASFAGTPEKIHDGEDSILWTGSAVQGSKFTFDSTDQANSGSQSVLTNGGNQNDIMQYSTTTPTSTASSVALTMFVFVDKDWDALDSWSVYGYNTTTAAQVGEKVFLEDFFDFQEFDVWQKISIPLENMMLNATGTITSFRFENEFRSGPAPVWYLDDFQLEQQGGTQTFKATADPGTKFRIDEIRIALADEITGTLADGTMPALSFDQLMDIASSTIPNGIIFQRVQDGEVKFTVGISQLGDFLSTGSNLINQISDGQFTFITLLVKFPTPIILDSRDDDFLSFTISADFSGLTRFTAAARGAVQNLQIQSDALKN